ncbi:hypothetical protein ABZT48_05260 [Streptomyces avermitilis]|uniref:hypothetical protein n=1 Tax=Streptomyces avermitilis TaxID=33903 RepID=UPI0033A6FC71
MNDTFSFEIFFDGAKKAANKAMEDHARGEYDEFALHAGVAIERLAKAALFKMNPLYIASGKVQVVTEQKKFTIHTITMSEALRRLAQLGIGKVTPSLQLLIELRNGTVHASGGDEAKAHIPTLAKAISAMLEHLEISEHAFWERWMSVINVAVNEQSSEIERDVQLRIKQARHSLDARLKGLPLPKKIRMPEKSGFSFFFQDVNPDTDQDVVSVSGNTGCPACNRQALVKAEPDATSPEATMVAVALSCPWCQLQLSSAEEIRAAGVDLEEVLEIAAHAIYGTSAEEPEDDEIQAG